jgi:3-dehydroquinate dehydratase
VSIVTAAITSTFVTRAGEERERTKNNETLTELEVVEARFDGLDRKLDRLEAALRELRGS